MSLKDIRSALVQTFESGGLALSGVYENDKFTPNADTPWFQFYYIPNPPVVASMGDTGFDEHTGIVQVNLNFPLNSGAGAGLAKADEIRVLFKAGSRHSYNGQEVKVRSCGLTGTGQLLNGYFQTILTISYTARTPR